MLYRIYTEYLGQSGNQNIEMAVSQYFDSFTIFRAEGYWKNQKELSTIVEIVAENAERRINSIANAIKRLNNQESVLVQAIN